MKITYVQNPLSKLKGDLLVVPYLDGKLVPHPIVRQIDQKLDGIIGKLLKKTKFQGKTGARKIFTSLGKLPFDYILILSLGKSKELDEESFRVAASTSFKVAKKLKVDHLCLALALAALKRDAKELATALCEGLLLSSYQFNNYKGKPSKNQSPQSVQLLLDPAQNGRLFSSGMKHAEIVSSAVQFSRDLGNTPSADKPPVKLAQVAKKQKGVRTRIFDKNQLKRLKMNGILCVGKGSIHPPCFVEMIYRPSSSPKKKIAIVGKGITFDSGGLSLKPPKSMEGMKDDMSGAGNVIAIMQAIGKLKPKVEVRGYLALAENMPSGSAMRPGDIYKAYNGKTVEVLNTDAEGRLVLGDALSYATEKKPDYLIDMATLTGSCLVALGERYAGIMGTDATLIKKIIEAGNYCNEKMWELPLAKEYEEDIKSSIADIKNVGAGFGGTITAGLFLKHFVGKSKWAHVDIAGPSNTTHGLPYCPKGNTGFMVRTLIKFLLDL